MANHVVVGRIFWKALARGFHLFLIPTAPRKDTQSYQIQPPRYLDKTPKFNIAPEKWWLEDDPFLLGPGNCSGVNSLLNFGRAFHWIHSGVKLPVRVLNFQLIGRLSHYLQGFIHPRWLGMGFLNHQQHQFIPFCHFCRRDPNPFRTFPFGEVQDW